MAFEPVLIKIRSPSTWIFVLSVLVICMILSDKNLAFPFKIVIFSSSKGYCNFFSQLTCQSIFY